MDVVVDRGVLDCCQHWFCFTCIDNWASITNLCPLCQNEFQTITCVPVSYALPVSVLLRILLQSKIIG
ncbi:putative transcription factor C2H2 family [Helianthus annuus]|nr:putative transcription factor C2H2 family [Helianthus annuus]KAJ0777530.1 putative transcription factor C2H2 family [Helianthus annuus]